MQEINLGLARLLLPEWQRSIMALKERIRPSAVAGAAPPMRTIL
jgi:hypothetical protein